MSKNILITGSSSGLGLATAKLLATQGHSIWLLNRNTEKSVLAAAYIKQAAPDARLQYVHLDLNRLDIVKSAADELLSLDRIDVLINNAGGLTDKRYVTQDGFEQQFQQNHLGHFALTHALMPLLLRSEARVINVSSEAHRIGRVHFEDLQGEKSYNSFSRYAEVKLMNILFTKALHERYHSQGLSAFALHPGVVNTHFGDGLGNKSWMWKLMTPFLMTPEKGAATAVFLATATPAPASGVYYKNKKPHTPSGQARDEAAATRLWEISKELLQKL